MYTDKHTQIKQIKTNYRTIILHSQQDFVDFLDPSGVFGKADAVSSLRVTFANRLELAVRVAAHSVLERCRVVDEGLDLPERL
jgi:hypothetical protein